MCECAVKALARLCVCTSSMRGSRKFLQRVSKCDNVFFFSLFFFLVGKGIEDTNTAINGPQAFKYPSTKK